MSIDRGMNKEVVHIYNGILLSHKKNKMMPFAAIWMDLEITEWSKSDTEIKISHGIVYMWNLKKNGYKWTYLQNRSRVTHLENKLLLPGDKGRGINC